MDGESKRRNVEKIGKGYCLFAWGKDYHPTNTSCAFPVCVECSGKSNTEQTRLRSKTQPYSDIPQNKVEINNPWYGEDGRHSYLMATLAATGIGINGNDFAVSGNQIPTSGNESAVSMY